MFHRQSSSFFDLPKTQKGFFSILKRSPGLFMGGLCAAFCAINDKPACLRLRSFKEHLAADLAAY
jgi:hypothetical protein